MFAPAEMKLMIKDFSKRIFAGQEFYPEFFFPILYSAPGRNRYHVSVSYCNRQNVFFTMEKKGAWTIIDAPKVPDGIIPVENSLEDAIIEILKGKKIKLSPN